jgi:ubiquitin-activating enzyme E1
MSFEKDDDAHMRVVASIGNLRARNYKIPEVDLHTARGIAGKITPAIATTTALVTGAVCLEIYKLVQNKPVTAYINTFSSLAVNMFTSMEPQPPNTTTSLVKGIYIHTYICTHKHRHTYICMPNPNMCYEISC